MKAHFGAGSPETLWTETHAYRHLCPAVGVRTPRAYYTGLDPTRGRAIVIMDDVISDGGRFLGAHADKEIVKEPVYDVKALDKMVTRVAREIQQLEQAIKVTNATTKVIGYQKDEAVLGELS